MPGRLDGKVAIVTGGGSGFGKAISAKFVAEGAKVLIAEMHPESGVAVAKELGCESIQADVTKRDHWQKVLQKSIELYGGPDVVVNNAGTCYSSKPSHEVTDEEYDLTMLVNYKSIYLSVAEIVPWMKENKKGGSFINIASSGAIRPKPNLTWYCGSKAAVNAASRSLAQEYATNNIRFNSVCPQFADTGLSHRFLGKPNTPENRAYFMSLIPLGRMTDVTDVANGCCYLASEEANYVTGTELIIDGGRCA
ncbi:oxidoreductase [Rhizodiscina lignyota]|uniref:Oxidoreductase n=1 Tax=Rhizodiscina lignyota TaxID=1504668 RepID=A0A9P4IJB1_9PEZI|nr:oxidoreductase [Rhizodiscina lignyota]